MNLGPQSSSDTVLTRTYRLLQSVYRTKILKKPFGHGPHRNSKEKYGNYLVNGEEGGYNFLDEYIFRYAKSKVLEKQVNPDLTIDEYRLFNNMLSSMPMAFNLFGLIRKFLEDGDPAATVIIKTAFPDIKWIEQVIYLDIEFIPRPIEDYINDKSAFDVFILAKDKKGKKGIISIETKYTDLLGSNSSFNRDLKDRLVEKENLFKDTSIYSKGYTQLARNFLLTIAYKDVHHLKYMEHVVLSPQEDRHSFKEIADFKNNLNKYKENIHKIDLEDFVESARKCESKEYGILMNKFYQRYLDLKLIENINGFS